MSEASEARKVRAKKRAARILGYLGGSAKTPRKAASSRLNGLKGGRPKKGKHDDGSTSIKAVV